MTITALSDAELLDQARAGDDAAFTELYVRHQAAALRLASTYSRLGDPDDLVNGAFERILGAIRRGGGPTESFRAYLFVTLRRLAAERGERPADESLDEVPEPVGDEADAPGLDQADRELITTAFESLPDRWQAVLWHTAVEGRQPRELAAVLGVSANAAAAMSYRAREKLRQAYLQAHLMASPSPEHEPYRSQLGAYVRDGLSARDRAAVQAHLDGCEPCRDLVAELNDVNRMLVLSVAPLFLLGGGGGAAVLVGAGGAAAAAGGGSDDGAKQAVTAGAASKGFVGKLKELAPSVGSALAIAAVLAALAGLGVMMGRGDPGPLDKADDAKDIGSPSGSGGDGSSGDGGSGADSGTGDSVFGNEDFALAPFDDGSLSDSFLTGFDEGSGVDQFDTFGSGSSSQPQTTPPATTPPLATTPPATAPPATAPPTTPPTTPPVTTPPTPPTLAFSTSAWTPLSAGRGSLDLTIGEAGVPAGLTASAFSAPAGLTGGATAAAPAQAAPAPLRLELTLTAGAALDPEAALDSRCGAPTTIPGPESGQLIACTLDQPPTGGTDTFMFGLVVNQPDQTAMLRLFRGDAVEAELPAALPLDRLEDGLALGQATWTPYRDLQGVPLPIGEMGVGASNTGTRPVAGGAIRISLGPQVGFVPPTIFSDQLPPEGLLDSPPMGNQLPPALRETLLTRVLDPLPEGCAVEGWTPPAATDTWKDVLNGGLAKTMVCQLGELAPQASLSFPTLLAVTQPQYTDPAGTGNAFTATIQLELDGVAVGAPQVLDTRVPGRSGRRPPSPTR